MTEYRRNEGRVTVIEITEPINFNLIRELTRASEISLSFRAPEVYRTKDRRFPLGLVHDRSTDAQGKLITPDGEISFDLGDFIVRDEIGRISVYDPDEFRHAFEAVNTDGKK